MSVKDKQEELRLQKELNELQKKSEEGITAGEAAAKKLLLRTTGLSDEWKNGVLGSITSSTEGMEDFVKSLKETVSISNILGSTMQKVVEATVITAQSFDQSSAALAGATGQGRKYNEQIIAISDSNRLAGVSIGKAADAIGDLSMTMTKFSGLSKRVQNMIVGQTAAWEAFGVAGATTGNILNNLTAGLGMSASQATGVTEDILKTSIALGIPPSQMAEAFDNAMPSLMSWGQQAPAIFKKVAAASKKLGVEMGTLIGFAEQFDTFDTAASSVAKLNQLMGGDALNAFEMMNATLDERNRLLLESFERSGKVWSAMGRMEQLAYMNAAGFRDMSEAAKFFEGGLSAWEAGQAALDDTTLSTKQLQQAQKEAISLMEKAKIIFQSFAIFLTPIIDILHAVAEGFLSVRDMIGKTGEKIVGLTIGGWLMIRMFKAAAISIGALKAVVAGAGVAGAAGGGGLVAGLGALTTGLSGVALAAPKILAGFAIIALGIGMVSLAVSILVSSFTEMFDAMAKITPATATAVGEVVSHAKEYATISLKDPAKDSFLQALIEANDLFEKKSATSKARGADNKDIILKINNETFAKAVNVAIRNNQGVKFAKP